MESQVFFFCTLLKASFKLAPYHFSKMILGVSLTTQRRGGHLMRA